jgi:hypothetical protein
MVFIYEKFILHIKIHFTVILTKCVCCGITSNKKIIIKNSTHHETGMLL